jgi:hypothetical protein
MNEEAAQTREQFERAQSRWRDALKAHRMAPPDPGFAARVAELAAACREDALACRAAEAWWEWPAVTREGEMPYELRPDTGRRGPTELWERFDEAVAALNRAGATTDLVEVSQAYDGLAEAAEALAVAVEREDHASVIPATARRRRSG